MYEAEWDVVCGILYDRWAAGDPDLTLVATGATSTLRRLRRELLAAYGPDGWQFKLTPRGLEGRYTGVIRK